ncbi:MAG: hypothetical protein JWO67_522 [Streptosporangiaceae bacterium]|nr:hypothetical protein [Streptosporangiaceae bacterium]
MEVRGERQAAPVADEVSALVAVTRPIIAGVFQSIGKEYLDAYDGDRSTVPLKMLGKLRAVGDGDCGVAFEYAVHDAVHNRDAAVTERVVDALKKCRVNGDPASILFAIEKQGAKQLISTEFELVTDQSRVLSGNRGQPVKLKGYLNQIAAAFRRPTTRPNLPQSIRGLWKADLFLGSPEPDHWVGTTVKINPSHLEAAPGLRIAVVPTRSGRSDAVRLDEQKNLVICPVPHDGSFMQVFYEGWRIVQALCETNFKEPKEVDIPNPAHREVARIYSERRDYPVLDVLDATKKFGQPHLLETTTGTVISTPFQSELQPGTSTIISPFPLRQ